MYNNSKLKWPKLPGKCKYELEIWLTDALVNSVKWSKNLNFEPVLYSVILFRNIFPSVSYTVIVD